MIFLQPDFPGPFCPQIHARSRKQYWSKLSNFPPVRDRGIIVGVSTVVILRKNQETRFRCTDEREVGNKKSLGCFLTQCTEVRNTGKRIGLGQKTDLVSAFRMRYERHGFREALSLDLGFRREVCNAMVLIFLARSDHRPFENRTKIFFPPRKM